MSPATAFFLRKLARLVPDERRELHRIARMPEPREYADELLRWARDDAREAWKQPADAMAWLRSALTWAIAAAICEVVP